MKIKLVLLLAFAFAALILPAQVKVSKGLAELDFDKKATGKAAWQKIYITAIVYPQLPYSVKACEILSNLQKEYPRQIKAFAIVPDTMENTRKFAAQYPTLTLTVCADEKFQETTKLLGSNFQQTSIFNASGKLLWSGEAIDAAMMVKRITGGKYSEQEEARLAALAAALQAALRSGNPQMIIQSADAILVRRDEQLSAVNAKAYALEMLRDYAGLEKFFRARMKKYPQEPANYFMLLEAAFRNPVMQKTAPAIAREYFARFPNNGDMINAIAWSLLNQMPYDSEAFSAAVAAEKLLAANPAFAKQPRVLMTRSLLAYRRCDLALAIKLAEQAAGKPQSVAEKAFITQILQYYKNLKK